jgi:hypothetical protein
MNEEWRMERGTRNEERGARQGVMLEPGVGAVWHTPSEPESAPACNPRAFSRRHPRAFSRLPPPYCHSERSEESAVAVRGAVPVYCRFLSRRLLRNDRREVRGLSRLPPATPVLSPAATPVLSPAATPVLSFRAERGICSCRSGRRTRVLQIPQSRAPSEWQAEVRGISRLPPATPCLLPPVTPVLSFRAERGICSCRSGRRTRVLRIPQSQAPSE